MNQTSIIIVVYVLGLLIGAFFFDLWGPEVDPKKALIALGWTALFLIGIFFSGQKKD